MKNSILGLEKDFIQLKDIELKDIEVKFKREIKELFFKPIIVTIDEMYRLEKKEIKKIRPIKKTCYEWLIDSTPKPIRKSLGGFKDKIVSLFKTNTPKETLLKRKETKKTKKTKS